jgi:periplasmic divalent cation tolerance protein
MNNVVLVFSTAPAAAGDDIAERIARTLIDEQLAACVNIHAPMVSIYRWKGAVERDSECQLVIKTTRAALPALEKRLRELHPYELPEFLVVAASGGSEKYLQWVVQEVPEVPGVPEVPEV